MCLVRGEIAITLMSRMSDCVDMCGLEGRAIYNINFEYGTTLTEK